MTRYFAPISLKRVSHWIIPNFLKLQNMKRWLALVALFASVTALALTWGADVPLRDLWSGDEAARGVAQQVFFHLRPQRVLTGMLAGAALAASGAALQAVFRNPLAEPYLLGISAGGALGAAIAVALKLSAWGGFAAQVPLAFGGALAAALVVYKLGQPRGDFALGFDRSGLLLCGVALSAFLAALMALVITLSNPLLAQQITFWMLGDLTRAEWREIGAMALMLALGMLFLVGAARDVDALQVGDEEASTLGVDVRCTHRRLLIAASLMSAGAVAAAGLIGFVGLLAPHMVRRVFGAGARALFPAAAIGGAALLMACDTLARSAVPPIEIPVGVITSLLGVPLFLWLMRR
jgi:iron complex transport system permease protein